MKETVVVIVAVLLAGKVFSQAPKDSAKVTQLQDVIIQGNRLDIPFSESTRDIQVITQQEIQRLPVKSINELLAYVGGVDIRQRGPFGAQADVSIDGGTGGQTLVLLNGIKLINAQSAHNMMNIPVPLEAIDHIEVLSGAAARVYGINALTGAINIVTKEGESPFVAARLHGRSSFRQEDPRDGSGIYAGGGVAITAGISGKHQNHL